MRRTHLINKILLATACLVFSCNAATATSLPTQAVTPEISPSPFTSPDNPTPLAPAANTYYVSPSGSNGNPGSQALPWATLQHAVDSVIPGDTILALSGTYAGARIEVSGTVNAWITLKAAPGAAVIINQPGPNNKHNSNLEIETWDGSETVAYWVIEGLEVTSAPEAGIDSRGSATGKNHHITIRGNRVHHNGVAASRTGIFVAFTDYVLVEDNESYNNSEHGVYINNSSDNFTVRHNHLYQNANCGLHMNGDASMGGDGIMSNGLVENNIIEDNGVGGGAAINMDGVSSSVVRNNLLYNNHATGIAIFQGDGAVCSQNNLFLHNTIRMASNGRWAILVADPACTGNQLFNNILISDHSYRGSINLAGGAPAAFTSNYNVVMDRFTTDDGDTVIPLNQWQALGYDANSFIATASALFVNPAANNYLLLPAGPAVDAGSNQGLRQDLRGVPRPCGLGFDIGAYEYCPPSSFIYLPTALH